MYSWMQEESTGGALFYIGYKRRNCTSLRPPFAATVRRWRPPTAGDRTTSSQPPSFSAGDAPGE
jgi:hypothetical protein